MAISCFEQTIRKFSFSHAKRILDRVIPANHASNRAPQQPQPALAPPTLPPPHAQTLSATPRSQTHQQTPHQPAFHHNSYSPFRGTEPLQYFSRYESVGSCVLGSKHYPFTTLKITRNRFGGFITRISHWGGEQGAESRYGVLLNA
eukprot:289978_1